MAKQGLVWRFLSAGSWLVTEKAKSSAAQLFRYCAVGILSNAAGYLVYLSITSFWVAPKLTMTVLYGVGATIGYVGNRNLTFAHTGSSLGSGVRYSIAHCVGYCLNLGLLVLFVDNFGYPHQVVQAIAIFVVAAFLFLVFKFYVFARPVTSAAQKP
jgi:putative flippase GtrA